MSILPYTFEPLSEEKKAERAKLYPSPRTMMVDMVWARPSNTFVTSKFQKIAEQVYNFDLRPDDVFMITFPKAGSTWTQEMLWQIVNDLDVEGGKVPVFFRSPFFEMTMLCGEAAAVPSFESENPMDKMAAFMADTVGYCDKMPKDKPRVFKTHLPLSMLPPKLLDTCRVVVVARNPNDSVVSWMHHEKILPVHGYGGDFKDMVKMYMNGEVLYGDYWSHLKEHWAQRDHPNVLFLWYEEMKKDLGSVIRKTSSFLKKDFPEEKVTKLVDHLSFDNFKNNDAVNMKPPKGAVPDEVRENFNFIRKGKVGGWREYFDGDLLKEWNAWVEKNNTDLNVPIIFEQE